MLFCGFQQVECSGDIRFNVELRFLDRGAHTRPRREVDDGIKPAFAKNALNGILIANIRLVNADGFCQGRPIFARLKRHPDHRNR